MTAPLDRPFVIVDDADPLLKYEGEWETNPEGVAAINRPNRAGPLYGNTSQWTTTNGSVSVSFNGSWARLQGTTNVTNSECPTCPMWTCTLDDGQSVPFVPRSIGLLNSRRLCDWGPLPEGPHTVVLNVTGRGDRFWVDFFRYIPSPDASIDPPPTLFVPAFVPEVKYDSSWTPIPDPDDVNTRMTNTPGGQLNFTFVGTSVAWYGVIPGRSPSVYSRAEYSIDGGPVIDFFINDFPETMTSARLTGQPFFKSPPLPYGRHELNVVYRGNPSSAPLSLHYFIVEEGTLGSALEDTVPGTGQGQPVEDSLTQAQLGGIIGGTCAAAAIIFLLFGYAIYLRRKNKNAGSRPPVGESSSDAAPPVSEMTIHPFIPSDATNSSDLFTSSLSPFSQTASPLGREARYKARVGSPSTSSLPQAVRETHPSSSSSRSTRDMSTEQRPKASNPNGSSSGVASSPIMDSRTLDLGNGAQRFQGDPEDRPPDYTPS
ncbi:hypothetical protein CC2G_013734 [Coprinopsis cinerea AmutBmut pab1-1]|nr:hypothetical protein CC2G_013734 [Coprinopsis cinerea AmutBmut pab1-1]